MRVCNPFYTDTHNRNDSVDQTCPPTFMPTRTPTKRPSGEPSVGPTGEFSQHRRDCGSFVLAAALTLQGLALPSFTPTYYPTKSPIISAKMAFDILEKHRASIESQILVSYTPSGQAYPSTRYTYDMLMDALRIMAVQGCCCRTLPASAVSCEQGKGTF